MQNIDHFIFDLDGTITHPQAGILGGYRYVFEKMRYPAKTDDELLPLIGPPLRHVFTHIYNLPEQQVEDCIRYYREYYYEKGGMYEAYIFEGMKEIFECLKENGKTLHIATNKALLVDKILEHFHVLDYFTTIEHYNEEKNVFTKEAMITNILEKSGITDKSKVVMIGDREHDLSAAQNIGIHSIGVLYGFGNHEELSRYAPDFIVATVAELQALLCP